MRSDEHDYEARACKDHPLAPMACRNCGATISEVEDGVKPKTCPAKRTANDK